jgi:hypothetical protein
MFLAGTLSTSGINVKRAEGTQGKFRGAGGGNLFIMIYQSSIRLPFRAFAACAGLVAASLSSSAPAATVLDVGNGNQVYSVASGTAAAISFEVDKSLHDVTISAPILCLGCTGSVWLQRDQIGASASFSGAIDAKAFSSGTEQPLFKLDDLEASLYFLILAIDSTSSGSGLWTGSSAPLVTSDGASRGLDFTATSLQPFVPFSNFSVKFGQNLNFTITADSAVPEPTTWIYLVIGFTAVGLAARRKAIVASA